ncbi:MAG: sulfatase-like hydrolase/transferase [Bryobacterales bacterium]|nr:sulfatase-like hydrolase/transferase [Bryobacterales bacterium]
MISRRDFLAASLPAALSGQSSPSRPNILLVLADDLGYGDLSCNGNRIVRTPNLDRFAGEGVRFTNCYSGAPNCSPARTALMTGRTPTRVGIHNWIPMLSPMHVRKSEVTIATLLQKAGYQTSHAGKWHLNGWFNLPGQPQPHDHGFQHWFSTQNNALPNHRNPYNFVRNSIPMGPQQGYAGQIVATEAIRWLKQRDASKPFFQFVCFHEPHEPIATDAKFADLYPSADPSYSAYWGNVAQMDDCFGQILRTLDELKLRDNTLVLFTGDNGPARTAIHPHGSTAGFRANKGHIYEGGIRVPGLLRWPGQARAGQVSDEPICGVDWLPTVCEATGIAAPTDRAIDGTSWLPTLKGAPISRRTPLYWHFNHATSIPKVAMRMGDWKVVAKLTGPNLGPGGDIQAEHQQAIKSAELAAFELYNLRTDTAEQNDLASSEPGRLKQMLDTLKPLYRSVRDESPTWPAWENARYEDGRIEWPAYRKQR